MYGAAHSPSKTASRMRSFAHLTFLLLLPLGTARSQAVVGRSDAVFTWRGALRADAQLTVKNFNGPIELRGGDAAQVEFRAEKRTERGGGAIEDVAFDIQEDGSGDVTICAVFRGNNPCDRWRDHDDDNGYRRWVTVAMRITVPRGARVRAVTGNGDLTVENVHGDVSATSGNGRVHVGASEGTVRVSTGNGDVDVRDAHASVHVTTGNGRVTVGTNEGPVDARTGNGDIEVTMTKLRAAEAMTFSTGSGDVRVTLPAGYSGELDASTGNGHIESDFELKVQGRMNPRRVRATIGDGGPRLRLSTGNGRLEIRKKG